MMLTPLDDHDQRAATSAGAAQRSAGAGGGYATVGGYPRDFLKTLGLRLTFQRCRAHDSEMLRRAAELAGKLLARARYSCNVPLLQPVALQLLHRLAGFAHELALLVQAAQHNSILVASGGSQDLNEKPRR
jgi:hypothetical protein